MNNEHFYYNINTNIINRASRINMYFNHQNDKLFEKNRTNINNFLSGLF